MRHRMNHRSRRAPSMWVPTSEVLVAVAAGAPTPITLVDASAGFTGTTLPQPAIARMTIGRILGQVHLQSLTSGSDLVSLGICIVPATIAPANLPDPGLQASRDYDWLFLRSYQFISATPNTPPTVTNNQLSVPYGPWVDVKSKRVLEPDHRLVLVVKAASAIVDVIATLRTLVSRTA